MIAAVNIAEVAALVGDPSRANMLAAMFDGRALTAGELAETAGVSAATASGHLAKLMQGRLVTVAVQGRHRYFRLASSEVARMLEQIAVVAGDAPTLPRATPRVPTQLREARTCYDHVAGRLGVAIADGLAARGAIILSAEAGVLTEAGRAAREQSIKAIEHDLIALEAAIGVEMLSATLPLLVALRSFLDRRRAGG